MADLAGIRVTDFYPLELHHIKALFVEKKYRRCIQACEDALSTRASSERSVQHAFINFYLGSCNDELARVIHDCSPAKLVYYSNAEAFYNEAIRALQSLRLSPQPPAVDDNTNEIPSEENDAAPITPCPIRQPLLDRNQLYSPLQSSLFGSPPTRIPTRVQIYSPWHSPSSDSSSPDRSESESYTEPEVPVTPPRMLQSDFSCMSLLDASTRTFPPQQSQLPALQRDISQMSLLEAKPESKLPHSISQTLLRPVTVGCSPKPYKSRVPVNVTSQHRTPATPPRSKSEATRLERANSLSPEPSLQVPARSLIEPNTIADVDACMLGERAITVVTETRHTRKCFDEHIKAMCVQIETHLRLLTAAKSQALAMQSKRNATPMKPVEKANLLTPNRNARLTNGDSGRRTDAKTMSKSRSYWLFSTEDIKATEREKRIDAGRLRMWKKERFNPKKYQDLAEVALAEL